MCFWSTPEVLHQKYGFDPSSTFFLKLELVELDIFGCEFFRVGGVKLIFMECCKTLSEKYIFFEKKHRKRLGEGWTLHTTRDRRSRQADGQRDGTVGFAGFRRDHGEWSGAAWAQHMSG